MRAALIVLSSFALSIAQCQLSWMRTFTEPEQASVWNLELDTQGNPMVSFYTLSSWTGQDEGSMIVRLSSMDGSTLNQGTLSLPDQSAFAAKVLPHGTTNQLLIIASVAPLPFGPLDSVRVATFLLDSSLTQLAHNTVGIPGRFVSYTQALAHPDGTIRIVYQTFDETLVSQFNGLTLDANGNDLQSLEANGPSYHGMGYQWWTHPRS